MARDGQRRVVARCCERAEAGGARPGMAAAQARAIFGAGAVRLEAHDPAGDDAALRRLAVWAERLAPIVGVDGPDGLALGVTGCERVWRGEGRLLRAAVGGLARLGFRARAAAAPTLACAWAVARYGDGAAPIVAPGGVHAALAPLPLAALRVAPETVARLAEVGVERIGEAMALPRATLPARFGDELLFRLDLAFGRAFEAIEPVRPATPPGAERVFDGPTDRVEAVELAVRGLLDEVAGELARRECGARSVRVELVRSDLAPETLDVTLGRPSRDAGRLWTLLRPKLERAHLGFGVEAVRVRAGAVVRVRHEQASCVASDGAPPAEVEREREAMMDALGNRLGPGRVLRPALAASRLPERAFELRRAPVLAPDRAAPVVPADRPTLLFDRPRPIEAIALTPDGPVHRVAWGGESSAVTACLGPERIGAEWWRTGARADRDYFAVRTEGGAWLWIARSTGTGRWFAHGVWA